MDCITTEAMGKAMNSSIAKAEGKMNHTKVLCFKVASFCQMAKGQHSPRTAAEDNGEVKGGPTARKWRRRPRVGLLQESAFFSSRYICCFDISQRSGRIFLSSKEVRQIAVGGHMHGTHVGFHRV